MSDDDEVGTGGIHFSRPLVELWYDGSSAPEDIPITATATNSETGDVGQKKDKNDGLVSFSYADGFEGEDHVVITRDDTDEIIAEFDTGFFKVASSNVSENDDH